MTATTTAKVVNIGDHNHERNNVTPPGARAEEVDWPSLPDVELGKTITDTYTSYQLLTRQAQRELRRQLLPALGEVRRRFKVGQEVGGFKTIKAYFKSIGIDPAKVRVWEQRDREEQVREIEEQQEQEWKAAREKARQEEKNRWESLTPEERAQKEAEEEAEAQAEREAAEKFRAWKEQFNRTYRFNQFAARKPTVSKAAKEMFKEYAPSVLLRGLAKKFHPDWGGSTEAMQTVNEVVDVLLPHIFSLLGLGETEMNAE